MKKILFVDDEPNILSGYQRQLRKQFPVETAVGPHAGLAALQKWQEYAVVVADMRMPEMNGVEFLTKVRQLAPDLVRMMLTGNADQGTAIDAINEGNIFRFLNKPCPPDKLVAALEDGLRQHELIIAERDLLENTLRGSVKVLSEILAMVEPKSFGYAETLRDNARTLSQFMNLETSWELEVAALLGHIGFVTLPPEVMLKSRVNNGLSKREQELFDRIPLIGSNLLSQIPRLGEVSRIILYQNQRFDGSGFPNDQVAGEQIPFGSRMLKALYDLGQLEGRGVAASAALDQMRSRHGWYDPVILDAIAGCFRHAQADPSGAKDLKLPLGVSLSGLRVGHILVSDVVTQDGILIIAAGNHITSPLLERLRNFAALSGIREPIQVEA